MDRRKFLKRGGQVLVGTSGVFGLPLTSSCRPTSSRAADQISSRRWGMVIDVSRCSPDCTECTIACRRENNVAYHGDRRWDIHWIRKVTVKEEATEVSKSVPLLCNHCDDPPCAQVCPVQATYKRSDGVVIVDHHRCIGCRYCMVACPYNARFFNFKENPDWPNKEYPKRSHGVVESCNFCTHRIDRGLEPACVEACRSFGGAALHFGDLNDPESNVSKLIRNNAVTRIREDLGTAPKVYYIGL